jgi:hypothetical protein
MAAPKELMRGAMAMGEPERVPAMCQLAIGHTLLQSGAHPVDFFLSNDAYADALLRVREMYGFDGILLHKPGRDPHFGGLIAGIDRDAATPRITLPDGAWIDCTRDDDPYLRGVALERPACVADIDPADPLAWAPPAFVEWCRHKGTANWRSPGDFPEYYYGAIDRVLAAAGAEFSVHGEVRAPLDHFLNIVGMEDGLLAMAMEPDACAALMETFTAWCAAWAVAQVRRGCDAVKVSSPYAGAGFISRPMYEEWVVPYERRVAQAVRAEGAFVYTHTCGAIGDRLDLLVATEIHGIETLDPPPLGTVDLAAAKRELRDRLFIKGNIDPVNSLLRKTRDAAREDVAQAYETGREGGQFILSTACSVAPRTPPENVRLLADCVHGRL